MASGGGLAASIVAGAVAIVMSAAADAQTLYQAAPFSPSPFYQPGQPPPQIPAYDQTRPYRQLPAVPPSWNYDPYTDGTVPTPHGGNG